MYGTSLYQIWIEKYGIEIANEKLALFKDRVSLTHKGRKRSEETKQRMKDAIIKRKENGTKRAPVSDETREKQSITQKLRRERNRNKNLQDGQIS
jgi:hypothetical protein